MNENDLLIPVYLNQRIVFDLLAMLQDGMSAVTRVTSAEGSSQTDNKRYGAAFGLSQALSSLLRIDVSGSRARGSTSEASIAKTEERIHTPASLFQKLRSTLKTSERIEQLTGDHVPGPGHFVEFSTVLHKNPLVEIMRTFVDALDMARAFSGEDENKLRKRGVIHPQERVKGQMLKVLETLKAGHTIDILSDPLENGYKAVVTLEEEYLNDPSMADLVDGRFSVLGKVIRVISSPDESISLLRKGVMGALSEHTLMSTFGSIATMQQDSFKVPHIEWNIHGPVVQVIPIAIYS